MLLPAAKSSDGGASAAADPATLIQIAAVLVLGFLMRINVDAVLAASASTLVVPHAALVSIGVPAPAFGWKVGPVPAETADGT